MATQEELDHHWMRHAIALAGRGAGLVSPNPLVGCVIARGDELLSEGWHERYGEHHAEMNALQQTSARDLTGATMYVTLEPCAHHGKQPPCAHAVADTDIARVVVGCSDPNPLVGGKGLEILRNAGKEVLVGVEEQACQWVARFFLHAMQSRSPYIIAKVATSLDNKIAMPEGSDRWLTSEESRMIVHRMRASLDAVLVGVGTVIADNPSLNVRLVEGRDPVRIIIDPHCRTPHDSLIAASARKQRTIIVTHDTPDVADARLSLEDRGFEIMTVAALDGVLQPKEIAQKLFERGIHSILLEGGAVTLDNFMHAGIIQEMHIHMAPLTLGTGREWGFHVDPRTWHLIETHSVGCDKHYLYRIMPH